MSTVSGSQNSSCGSRKAREGKVRSSLRMVKAGTTMVPKLSPDVNAFKAFTAPPHGPKEMDEYE